MKEKNNLYADCYSGRQLFRVFSVQEAWDDFTAKINKAKGYSDNGINYDGYKKVMANDYKCFITDGLPLHNIDIDLGCSFLYMALENYEEMCQVFNDFLKLYEEGQIKFISDVFERDELLFKSKANKFYLKHKMFFDGFNLSKKETFLCNFNYYMGFMFYMMKILSFLNESKRTDYLNKAILNLKKVDKLKVEEAYLIFDNFWSIGENVNLYYQPEGEITDGRSKRVFYREENIYSDVSQSAKPSLNNDYVKVFLHHPKFFLKGFREIGFNLQKGGNYDEQKWNMYIYDMTFNGTLLDNFDLENTMSDLDLYQQLIYDKKLEILKKKLTVLYDKVTDLKLDISDLILLFDELGIERKTGVDEFTSLSLEELSMVEFACKKNKQKVLK